MIEAWDGPVAPPWEELPPPEATGPRVDDLARDMVDGAAFLLDLPTTTPAVWGAGSHVLWAEGESLQLVGGNGLGKTTIAGQLVRARLGLADSLLQLPVRPGARRTLYLAMDRPRQIARALGRCFDEGDRDVLAERLVVRKGPPPLDLAKFPEVLVALCEAADADTVVVDSLKDAALGLSDDVVGAGWNRARQAAITSGVEVLELHHPTKRHTSVAEPVTIGDVYGSAWITAGVGSVVMLTGAPGDPIVGFRHLKQPAEEVGPWRLIHDHDQGRTTVFHDVDLVQLAQRRPLTVRAAAAAVFEREQPSAAEVQKARRRLDALVTTGQLARREDPDDPRGTQLYVPADLLGLLQRDAS